MQTALPQFFAAGDTLQFQRALSDFPASQGWSLSYTLVCSSGAYTFSSTPSGNDHLVTVPGTVTATYAPGLCSWVAYVSRSGERFSIDRGSVTILPDPATATAADPRSHARRVLDAIESLLEGTASREQMEMDVEGTRLKYRTPDELYQLRLRYLKEWKAEQRNVKPGRFCRQVKVYR